ncbi:MAG: FAD-dependent oxidoreductase [Geminocystis sp.]|nr:FAD-dependent oxidoreductase [Geminocystis sp.]MCS7147243.1 FAD-dependent oxidoreductase [Geminocystis sp.]MDW8116239.1 FAD-dependent oxidoreductase [Geminocystis sp.]MDW8462769.1 FAD-dependent oxidoreductase [Geminocystis sp.]
MKIDYDLIVIGDTKAAIFAVEYALQFDAKVALFLDNKSYNNPLVTIRMLNEYWQNYHHTTWEHFCEFKQLIFLEKLNNLHSVGVDIYRGSFRVINGKKILLSLEGLLIKSSGIILAAYPCCEWLYPQYNLLINHSIGEINKLAKAAAKFVIFGDDIEAIILAQNLSNFGNKVTLITQNKCLLPGEDEDISWQYQLHLESQGVDIRLESEIGEQLEVNGDKLIITRLKQKNNQATELYENLGICWDDNRILVNERLQTHNPKVFACGEILGGYDLDNLSYHEARVAVNNSLFLPWQRIDYNNLGYCLNTSPKITRIGYSEYEAMVLFGNNLRILKFHLDELDLFVKFVISNDGDILGFHSLGDGLEEILNIVNAIKLRREKISSLFSATFADIRSYKIVETLKEEWLQHAKKRRKIIMDTCQNFFLWKRTLL